MISTLEMERNCVEAEGLGREIREAAEYCSARPLPSKARKWLRVNEAPKGD
jgi:hypothetical protein